MRSLRSVFHAYLIRAVVIWVTMRLAASIVILFAGENPFRLAPPVLLALVVLPAALMAVDIHRRREAILLGNLGVSVRVTGLLALVPAVVGESSLFVLGRLF